jgi:hypothetical protein
VKIEKLIVGFLGWAEGLGTSPSLSGVVSSQSSDGSEMVSSRLSL